MSDDTTKGNLVRLGEMKELMDPLIEKVKPLSAVKARLATMPRLEPDDMTILFQHSVLCQTSMPYRDPGDDVREWQRSNGNLRLHIQAGVIHDPKANEFVRVGLPFGTKPRLLLYHLNTAALKTQSPVLDVEQSLTAFVNRLGLADHGRNVRAVKEQLSRLVTADFRIGISDGLRGVSIQGPVISGLELWTPRDPKQKVLWPSTVRLSQHYFDSLLQHAVPLDEAAITRLSHTAMGLDIYTWMAQRLHRVDPRRPTFITWPLLKEQYGQGYNRLRNFKRDFQTALSIVQLVYSHAKFTVDDRGLTLHQSQPPVLKRYSLARA